MIQGMVNFFAIAARLWNFAAAQLPGWVRPLESSNLRIIGHPDLSGKGNDQFLMIVDMRDPRKPREAGRWWLPGMRKGEAGAPLPRLKIDSGYRLHTLLIDPRRPKRIRLVDIRDEFKPTLLIQRCLRG